MEQLEYLARYYENYDEDGRLLLRQGLVEYRTTMRYIEKYLRPNMHVCEIGAGTGRYSHALAQQGYRVDAVELLQHNINIFNSHTRPDEPVSVVQGDARSLPLADDSYDLTLLLGPMYHLFTRDDQLQALREAVRVTKPDGVIFAAYCMADAAVLQYGFVRGHIGEIMEKCMVDPDTFEAFSHPWDIFALYRTEDIRALREQLPVTQLRLFAADGYANHMRSTLASMDEQTFELYMRYHLATCERPGMLDISNHVVDVMQKA